MVDIDKLVAQSSLSIRQCQSLRLFRLGAVFWKKWILLEEIHIDGKPMEFEWKIFPGHKTAGILNEI